MLKNKAKLIILLICIVMLISCISFATNSTVPGDNARTTESNTQTTSEENTTPITGGENTRYNSHSELHQKYIMVIYIYLITIL